MYRDKEQKWQSASLLVIFPLIINMSMIDDICMYSLCAMDLLTAKARHHNSSPPNAPYMSANGVSIGSGNGLSPVRCQSITWTKADILLVRSFKTNLSEVRIKIQNIFFITNALKTSFAKWRWFCPGQDVLITCWHDIANRQVPSSLISSPGRIVDDLDHLHYWMMTIAYETETICFVPRVSFLLCFCANPDSRTLKSDNHDNFQCLDYQRNTSVASLVTCSMSVWCHVVHIFIWILLGINIPIPQQALIS